MGIRYMLNMCEGLVAFTEDQSPCFLSDNFSENKKLLERVTAVFVDIYPLFHRYHDERFLPYHVVARKLKGLVVSHIRRLLRDCPKCHTLGVFWDGSGPLAKSHTTRSRSEEKFETVRHIVNDPPRDHVCDKTLLKYMSPEPIRDLFGKCLRTALYTEFAHLNILFSARLCIGEAEHKIVEAIRDYREHYPHGYILVEDCDGDWVPLMVSAMSDVPKLLWLRPSSCRRPGHLFDMDVFRHLLMCLRFGVQRPFHDYKYEFALACAVCGADYNSKLKEMPHDLSRLLLFHALGEQRVFTESGLDTAAFAAFVQPYADSRILVARIDDDLKSRCDTWLRRLVFSVFTLAEGNPPSLTTEFCSFPEVSFYDLLQYFDFLDQSEKHGIISAARSSLEDDILAPIFRTRCKRLVKVPYQLYHMFYTSEQIEAIWEARAILNIPLPDPYCEFTRENSTIDSSFRVPLGELDCMRSFQVSRIARPRYDVLVGISRRKFVPTVPIPKGIILPSVSDLGVGVSGDRRFVPQPHHSSNKPHKRDHRDSRHHHKRDHRDSRHHHKRDHRDSRQHHCRDYQDSHHHDCFDYLDSDYHDSVDYPENHYHEVYQHAHYSEHYGSVRGSVDHKGFAINFTAYDDFRMMSVITEYFKMQVSKLHSHSTDCIKGSFDDGFECDCSHIRRRGRKRGHLHRRSSLSDNY